MVKRKKLRKAVEEQVRLLQQSRNILWGLRFLALHVLKDRLLDLQEKEKSQKPQCITLETRPFHSRVLDTTAKLIQAILTWENNQKHTVLLFLVRLSSWLDRVDRIPFTSLQSFVFPFTAAKLSPDATGCC